MQKTLLFSFLLVLCACRQPAEKMEVRLTPVSQAKYSDIIKDYSFVCLETTEDNLILDPTVVKLYRDWIFILDRFSPEKSLYVFAKDGSYIGKVGRKGEGPGEYVMPHYFVVDEARGQLLLRDIATGKLLCYDAATLDFVADYKIPFNATCFEKLGDDKLVWYVNTGLQNTPDFQKHIQITDMQCRPVQGLIEPLPFPKRGLFKVQSYFTQAGGTTCFHHPFLGEYHKVSADGLSVSPAFTLCLEGTDFPSQDFVISHQDEIVASLEEQGYLQWCDWYETSSAGLCYAGTAGETYWGLYDKKSGKGWYVDKRNLEDDLGIHDFSRPKGVAGDYFISLISLENVEIPEHSILKEALPEEEEIDRNPVLLLFRPFS